MTSGGHEVEWLDDEGNDHPRHDEELAAGSARPPLGRRTRIALGLLAVAVVGAAVTVGVTADGDDRPVAAPTTRTVSPTRGSGRTVAVALPQRPPAPALTAIRVAFPGAELTSFTAALAPGNERDVFTFYNIRSRGRLITIMIGPPRPGDMDAVFRTASSFEIKQALGRMRVQVLLRTEKGNSPTARDFAALQQLVQDTRLLATQ